MTSLIPMSVSPPTNLSADMSVGTALKTYVFPVAAVIVITNIANGAIEKMFSTGDSSKIDKLYDEMLKHVESSNLPRTGESPEMKNMRDMSSLIDESITSLRKAQQNLEVASGKTDCGVCNRTFSKLTDTIENDVSEIEKNTKGIVSASKKYSSLKHLKKMGKIDSNKNWKDLTDEEKDLIIEFTEE